MYTLCEGRVLLLATGCRVEESAEGRVLLTKGTEVFDGHKLVWASFDLCIDLLIKYNISGPVLKRITL